MERAPILKYYRWSRLLILPALLAVCGCGNQTATVTGKVTYNGRLLKGGSVTYVSTEGKPSISGSISEDGSYTLVKVPVGLVKICVDTESLNPANIPKAPMKYGPPAGQSAPEGFSSGDADTAKKRFVKIPETYGKEETTTLTYSVTPGDQQHDIDLK